jgi:hypothetical protein
VSALTPKQAIALQLLRQDRTIAQVQTNTGLAREQIVAAVDRAWTQRFLDPNKPMPPCRKRTGRNA